MIAPTARGRSRARAAGLASLIALSTPAVKGAPTKEPGRGASRPRESVDHLLAALQQGSEGAQDRAAQRLFFLQDPRANSAVLALAGDRDARRRAVGLRAIAIIRPPGTPAAVMAALTSDDLDVLRAAVNAAGVIELRGAAKRLTALLAHPDPSVRMGAIQTLGRLGQAGLPGLRRAVTHGDLAESCAAVTVLGRMEGSGAAALLRGAARRAKPEARVIAASVLFERGDAAGLSALALLLQSPRKGIRLQAISAVAEHRSRPGARRLLRRAARSPDADVRRSAADALAASPDSATQASP